MAPTLSSAGSGTARQPVPRHEEVVGAAPGPSNATHPPAQSSTGLHPAGGFNKVALKHPGAGLSASPNSTPNDNHNGGTKVAARHGHDNGGAGIVGRPSPATQAREAVQANNNVVASGHHDNPRTGDDTTGQAAQGPAVVTPKELVRRRFEELRERDPKSALELKGDELGLYQAQLFWGEDAPPRLKILRTLGRGAFGSVFLAKAKAGREALKAFVNREGYWGGEPADWGVEVWALKMLQDVEGVPKLLGHSCGRNFAFIHQEYCELGDLDSFRERTDEEEWRVADVLGYVRSVAGTLAEAHAKGIIHRDIKPRNIFVQKDGAMMVGDWGLAISTDESAKEGVIGAGTRAYMAPEVGGKHGPKVDVYSTGVFFYWTLVRTTFSPGFRGFAANATDDEDWDHAVWQSPLGPPMKALVKAMCQADPELRPAMTDVVEELVALEDKLASSGEEASPVTLPVGPVVLPPPAVVEAIAHTPVAVVPLEGSAPPVASPSPPALPAPGAPSTPPTLDAVVPSASNDAARAPSPAPAVSVNLGPDTASSAPSVNLSSEAPAPAHNASPAPLLNLGASVNHGLGFLPALPALSGGATDAASPWTLDLFGPPLDLNLGGVFGDTADGAESTALSAEPEGRSGSVSPRPAQAPCAPSPPVPDTAPLPTGSSSPRGGELAVNGADQTSRSGGVDPTMVPLPSGDSSLREEELVVNGANLDPAQVPLPSGDSSLREDELVVNGTYIDPATVPLPTGDISLREEELVVNGTDDRSQADVESSESRLPSSTSHHDYPSERAWNDSDLALAPRPPSVGSSVVSLLTFLEEESTPDVVPRPPGPVPWEHFGNASVSTVVADAGTGNESLVALSTTTSQAEALSPADLIALAATNIVQSWVLVDGNTHPEAADAVRKGKRTGFRGAVDRVRKVFRGFKRG